VNDVLKAERLRGVAHLIVSRRAVVFDCDGTLVKLTIDPVSTRKAAIDILEKHGVPSRILSINDPILLTIKKGIGYLRLRGEPSATVLSEVDRVVEVFEMKAARETSLLPGAVELLSCLRRLGFKLGLFTLNKRSVMEYILERFNLNGFFDAMAARDDVPAPKPDKRHLEEVFLKLSVKPRDVVVVGDHPVDALCALRAGATPIGVLSSGRQREDFEKCGVQYVVKSVAEILAELKCYLALSRPHRLRVNISETPCLADHS